MNSFEWDGPNLPPGYFLVIKFAPREPFNGGLLVKDAVGNEVGYLSFTLDSAAVQRVERDAWKHEAQRIERELRALQFAKEDR